MFIFPYLQKTFYKLLTRYPYLPTPPPGQDMTQGQFLSGVWQVWIQSFPPPRQVASPRLKNTVCPTILPIAGGRIIGFIPFPRVLVLCEMQLAWSRIWTRVAVSISYNDNHYTTGTSSFNKIYSKTSKLSLSPVFFSPPSSLKILRYTRFLSNRIWVQKTSQNIYKSNLYIDNCDYHRRTVATLNCKTVICMAALP